MNFSHKYYACFSSCFAFESQKILFYVNHIRERERYKISSPSWQYLMNKLWTLPQNLRIPGELFHFHFQIQKLLMTTLWSKFSWELIFSPFCYQPILVSQRAYSSPYRDLYKCILLSSKRECWSHAKKDNIVKECTCDDLSQTLKQILTLSWQHHRVRGIILVVIIESFAMTFTAFPKNWVIS